MRGTTIKQDSVKMSREGFFMVGWSSFSAGQISDEMAIAQAKKVGADRVVVYKDYRNTKSGVIPLTLPDTRTAYHSGSVFGSGGSAMYSGTSTTYGTQTTYIPYSVDRYNYGASYWRKIRQGGLGVSVINLSTADRQRIGSNKGTRIVAIQKGSAAFNADILEGDIIRRVDDTIIIDMSHAIKIIRSKLGSEITLVLDRAGTEIVKKVYAPRFE
jgi:membrane-associated protease RseP (regulator of RpoE activity)